MTARQFSMQIDMEWARAKEDMRELVVEVGTNTLAGVVEKSPVDTGHFQNNWLVSIGGADGQIVPLPGDFSGENASTLASYMAGEGFPEIVIQNNLPYAARLEDGYSSQAPSGMVALTVAEIEAMYDGTEI